MTGEPNLTFVILDAVLDIALVFIAVLVFRGLFREVRKEFLFWLFGFGFDINVKRWRKRVCQRSFWN